MTNTTAIKSNSLANLEALYQALESVHYKSLACCYAAEDGDAQAFAHEKELTNAALEKVHAIDSDIAKDLQAVRNPVNGMSQLHEKSLELMDSLELELDAMRVIEAKQVITKRPEHDHVTLCAVPYSYELPAFYFSTIEEYETKLTAAKVLDESGDFEHCLEFIDGEDSVLNAWNISRKASDRLSALFMLLDKLEENELTDDSLVIIGHYIDTGYSYEEAQEKAENAQVITDLMEHAYEQLEQNGIKEGSFAYRYFDHEQFIIDLKAGGELEVIRESYADGNMYVLN